MESQVVEILLLIHIRADALTDLPPSNFQFSRADNIEMQKRSSETTKQFNLDNEVFGDFAEIHGLLGKTTRVKSFGQPLKNFEKKGTPGQTFDQEECRCLEVRRPQRTSVQSLRQTHFTVSQEGSKQNCQSGPLEFSTPNSAYLVCPQTAIDYIPSAAMIRQPRSPISIVL